MGKRRALRRTLSAAILVAAALLALAAIGAVIPRPFTGLEQAGGEGEGTRRVLLLAGAIHTDLALPADPDVLAAYGFLEGAGLPVRDPAVRWLAVGWGGREFYIHTPTWDRLQAWPLLRGLTLDQAAMHVQLAGEMEMPHASVLALDLAPEQFAKVLAASLAGFRRGEDGAPELIEGAAYNAFDAFYEANGQFTALMGCNTWAGAALRAGGVRTGWWNPLPQSLFWSVRLFNGLDETSNGPIGPQDAASASQP